MEKKTTQRIVGILVVIALVIILLPLLLDKNDASATQTASVSPPPFPDQQQATPPTTVADANNTHAGSSIYISPEIADKINKVASPQVLQVDKQDGSMSSKPVATTSATAQPVAKPITTQAAAQPSTLQPVAQQPATVPVTQSTVATAATLPVASKPAETTTAPQPVMTTAQAPVVTTPAINKPEVVAVNDDEGQSVETLKTTSHAKAKHLVKTASQSHVHTISPDKMKKSSLGSAIRQL